MKAVDKGVNETIRKGIGAFASKQALKAKDKEETVKKGAAMIRATSVPAKKTYDEILEELDESSFLDNPVMRKRDTRTAASSSRPAPPSTRVVPPPSKTQRTTSSGQRRIRGESLVS